VPKPFTPFQFEPQDTVAQFREKQIYLKNCIRSKKISYRYHEGGTSMLEAVLARGDRRLCAVVESAWRQGANLEGWSEHYDQSRWDTAMEESGLTYDFYANRRRDYDEVLPWDHLDYVVSKAFFVRENKLAHEGVTTQNCREHCSGCGAAVLYGEGRRLPPCR
jgi:hypothetical protein